MLNLIMFNCIAYISICGNICICITVLLSYVTLKTTRSRNYIKRNLTEVLTVSECIALLKFVKTDR
jgi:hypothetical protein